jgi:predicted Zn-dependent peptidase
MIKKKILIDEYIYMDTLKNGLKVYIHPKNDFIDYHVSLQVKIGGETLSYQYQNQSYQLPPGTAHFIEHVMFEKDGKNLSDVFAEYQADINASTSRDSTTYYFNVQHQFETVFKMFLEHFSKPSISIDTIEKEREIILKEIKMYEDNLYYQTHEDLLKLMYQDPRMWMDIAGSEESVKKINQSMIDQTINHFYQPANMILVVTGPIDPDSVFEFMTSSSMNLMKNAIDVPTLMKKSYPTVKQDMYVVDESQNVSYFALGLKINLDVFKHLSVAQRRLTIIMLFHYFFDDGSTNYKILRDKHLVNYSYSFHIHVSEDYAYFSLSSETNDPKKLKSTVIDMLMNIGTIDRDKFIAAKRGRIGQFIGYFDGAGSINQTLTTFLRKGYDVEQYIPNVEKIKLEDLYLTKKVIDRAHIYSVTHARK